MRKLEKQEEKILYHIQEKLDCISSAVIMSQAITHIFQFLDLLIISDVKPNEFYITEKEI